jgi:Tfp pilus assembly protein PilF
MRRLLLSALAALVAVGAPLAIAPHAAAQPRPSLPRNADPNDWESYFDAGERLFTTFPGQADTAFLWAARLDPTRAEPLLARWAAFYARDQGLWIDYLEEDPRTLRRQDVIDNEEHLSLAYARNPFVHRGLEAALLSRLGRRLRWDGGTRGFMAYGRGDFDEAARIFGRLVRGNPRRHLRLRHYLALSLIGAGRADSAAVEIEALLAALRSAEEREVGDGYESKAAWEHALGLLYEIRGDTARARRAYERSLEEDLAWYPARMGLGRLELRAGNADGAVVHLAQAVEIAPGDGVVRLDYANALLAAGWVEEGAQQCRVAMEMEPYWPEVYLRLAYAHDALGERGDAASMYRAYLERAPRRQAQTIERLTRRLAEIAPGP